MRVETDPKSTLSGSAQIIFTTNPFLRRDFTEALDHAENDLLRFIRTGHLTEEPLSDPERRADLIAQGATVAELDAESEQYREAMRSLRRALSSFLSATEGLEAPAVTVPTGAIVRVPCEAPPPVV